MLMISQIRCTFYVNPYRRREYKSLAFNEQLKSTAHCVEERSSNKSTIILHRVANTERQHFIGFKNDEV